MLRKRCCRGANGYEIARTMPGKPPRKKRENHRMRKALIRKKGRSGKVKKDELHEVSKAEYDIYILTCLLHYHERMKMPVGQDMCQELAEGKCPKKLVQDKYAEALWEAIRCIRIVHDI